ncbi:hypothetical protein [uncultured Thiohalocapsa sp.]|uniref:hypothetical protein n=1 Tax=uncultured Thiohalocapsa sp. TaxID=768990 RepID=UPI0025D84602|nr:hypothetical protein [uncultured Thiohalocapsa sp.]
MLKISLPLRTPVLPALAALCMGAGVHLAAADTGATDWQFQATPYLWLPAVDASAQISVRSLRNANGDELGPVSISTDLGPRDYLENLNMAVMAMGEARKGPWSVYTDVLYTSFAQSQTTLRRVSGPRGNLDADISRKARTDLSTTAWTLAAGYRVVERPTFDLDLMAGFRYLSITSDLELTLLGEDGRFLRQPKVSLDQDLWDGIIGARGHILFPGSDWYVPYYADIGTAGSNWTWQAMLGLGYRFDWGEVTLAYRAIGYELDTNDMDLTLHGPGLGIGFRW